MHPMGQALGRSTDGAGIHGDAMDAMDVVCVTVARPGCEGYRVYPWAWSTSHV